MKYLLTILPLLIIFQTGMTQKAEESYLNYIEAYPHEKVVINFSKQDYNAGETIHFTTYVLTGYQPSVFSTNVYVELYSAEKNMIDKTMVPLYIGAGSGSLTLPADLPENVYYLRAYTTWMLNFSEALQYVKSIPVYNPYSSKKLTPRPVRLVPTIHTEGGVLREGLLARLAIRLSGSETLPQSWTASLYEKGNPVPLVQSVSYNPQVAELQFIPFAGKSYYVVTEDAAGNRAEADVQPVQNDGTVFQLRNNGQKIDYFIHFKSSSTGEGYKLLGTTSDAVVFKAEVKKASGKIAGSIDTKELGNGVMMLTLFDEKGQPVAQRLTFLNQRSLAIHTPELQTDTLQFSPKSINSWSLKVDSLSGYSYVAQVTDGAYPLQSDFISSIFLTADFNTPVYEPAWYFQDADDRKQAALEALLITEKWQRFSWNDVLHNRFPAIRYVPEKYLSFYGAVTRRNKPEIRQEVNIVIQDKNSTSQVLQVTTDSTGHFLMDQLYFTDTVRLMYQLNSKKVFAKNIRIDFRPLHRFIPYQSNFPASPYTLITRRAGDSLPAHVQRSAEALHTETVFTEKVKILDEVVVRFNRRSPAEELDAQLSTGLFQSFNQMIFDFINEDQTSAMASNNILEWLQGRVPGFALQQNNGMLTPYLRNAQAGLFLDEMPVSPDLLQGFNVNDIAMIKVIRGVFLGGSNSPGGAIAIYSKRGGMRSKFDTQDMPMGYLQGYRKPAPVFSPDYSESRLRDVDDKRFLLFRSQSFTTESATMPIRFYNNDEAKSFRIIVTGFTANGTPVFLNQSIHQ